MKVTRLQPEGLVLIEPDRFGDERGFFSESWNARRMAEHGLDIAFLQDNHSLSRQKGTLRGLHFQAPPHAQDKLVRCGRGALLDVAVDIRTGSPTFGHWASVELSAQNGRQLLVPKGFLHGFATLEDDTEVIYKCSDYYAPECDGTVAFDDPALGINWGVSRAEAILSPKDQNAPLLCEIGAVFHYEPSL